MFDEGTAVSTPPCTNGGKRAGEQPDSTAWTCCPHGACRRAVPPLARKVHVGVLSRRFPRRCCLSRALARPAAEAVFRATIRGLALDCLGHPAQLDHYLSTPAANARAIVVRLLGGRGHWSYGLEQLQGWCAAASDRELVILAGTADQDVHLHELGSINADLAGRLAACLREGGERNMLQMLAVLAVGGTMLN